MRGGRGLHTSARAGGWSMIFLPRVGDTGGNTPLFGGRPRPFEKEDIEEKTLNRPKLVEDENLPEGWKVASYLGWLEDTNGVSEVK